MDQKMKKIFSEVYSLFKEDNNKKQFQYVRKNWIFPNHINIMIEIIKKLNSKYKGNLEICVLAAILHDTGLVYKRNSSSTAGHEERSIKYAKKILKKYEYPENKIIKIINCIRSTRFENKPTNINEKIVRTADSLSQFISIHFFAKAAFSQDINTYINWLKNKVEKNYQKICFKDEIEQAKPIRNYILRAIKMYYKCNKK